MFEAILVRPSDWWVTATLNPENLTGIRHEPFNIAIGI